MYKKFLKEFFLLLNTRNLDYLVLRGYEDLPTIVHHDIDLVVKEDNLMPFFSLLHEMSKTYNYVIKKDTVRQGLLKTYLDFGSKSLQIDIFCEFRYAGLEYIDIEDLFINKRSLITEINVPNNNYELAASFLKEILHNSRIRKDKVVSIRQLFKKTDFSAPFSFFSKRSINNFLTALFTENKFEFKGIAMFARIDLLLLNLKKRGSIKSIKNIYIFFWIKYFNQNYYDKYIFLDKQ